ncbi:hypothetical protein DFH09DRAFT_1166285, partial [Mycena vulgaris]
NPILQGASAFQAIFEKANLELVKNVARLNTPPEDGSETDDIDELAAQTNAKSNYITAIVSDIDDAAIITAEGNKALAYVCDEKKERLRIAKAGLAEVRTNIRTLASMMEQDYVKLKESAAKAAMLTQKIIDARLALTRLRHAHPQPRLTIPGAEQRLADQVTEMQRVQSVKGSVKSGTQEAEKAVKAARVDEDDARLVPLYDHYVASLALHRSVLNIHDSQSVSENEVRRQISIMLIFVPNTKRLASASVSGLDELGMDVAEIRDAHLQNSDTRGLIAAVLALARAAP